MVVCICNILPESKIAESIQAGATTYEKVLELLEARPVCYTCQTFIEEMLTNASV